MNADTLLAMVRDSLASDDDLIAWSVAQFAGSKPTVYLDVDEASPPATTEYPVIAINALSRDGALSKNGWTAQIDIACGVINETVTRAETAGGIVTVTHEGMVQAARLAELAELAILRSLRSAYPQISITGESGQVSEYPLFAAFSTLSIEQMPSSRSPRLK